MNKAIAGGLTILLLAGIPAFAITINVGDHYFPRKSGPADDGLRSFQIWAESDPPEFASFMNLNLQVGDGGPEVGGIDGPSIVSVDLWSGTVFGDAPYGAGGLVNPINDFAPQFYEGGVWTSGHVDPDLYLPPEIAVNGLIATVTVDLEGFAPRSGPNTDGSWNFIMSETLNGATVVTRNPLTPEEQQDLSLRTLPLTVNDGTISIIPEPATLVMLLAMAAAAMPLLWRGRIYNLAGRI